MTVAVSSRAKPVLLTRRGKLETRGKRYTRAAPKTEAIVFHKEQHFKLQGKIALHNKHQQEGPQVIVDEAPGLG